MKKSDGMIRVGGVGTGRIFQWAHLNPYLRLMDKARLVGFYDVQPERAVSLWKRSAACDGTLAIVHRNLGWAAWRLGKAKTDGV